MIDEVRVVVTSLEVDGNHLGNLSKGQIGLSSLNIGTCGVRVQEEGTLIALGGIGVLLLLLFLLLAIIIGVRVVTGRDIVFHLAEVTLLVRIGLFIPFSLIVFGELLELGGEKLGLWWSVEKGEWVHAYTKQHGSKRQSTYNISKLGMLI